MGMTFTFNGTCSSNANFDLKIATAPTETSGAYSGEFVSYEGRYGKRFPSFGVYGNCQREYSVSLLDYSGKANLLNKIGLIRKWLYVQKYCRLTDTYDTSCYRKAACISPVDFSLFEDYFAQASIQFDCDPRRFLTSGEAPISCTNNGTVTNNYMECNPTISITASGAGHVYLGNSDIQILSTPGAVVKIDTELMTITNPAGSTNLSDKVAIMNEFPKLKQGNNSVSWTGSVSAVSIVPNWWLP